MHLPLTDDMKRGIISTTFSSYVLLESRRKTYCYMRRSTMDDMTSAAEQSRTGERGNEVLHKRRGKSPTPPANIPRTKFSGGSATDRSTRMTAALIMLILLRLLPSCHTSPRGEERFGHGVTNQHRVIPTSSDSFSLSLSQV